MVTIVTDSTADLSPDLISRFQLEVVPLLVTINGETYQDGVNLPPEKIFNLVAATGSLPLTAAPSIITFMDMFNKTGDMVYVGLSSKISSTFQNATLAAHEISGKDIFLINSLNLSTGIGLLACKAAELRQQGLDATAINQAINQTVPKIRTAFVIETMEYLYKGGRCSALQNLFGSLLKIRPVIEVKSDGTMGVKDKIRGTRKKALDSLVLDLRNNLERVDLHRIFITHSGCAQDAEYLRDEILKFCAPDEICLTQAGAVISSHCGPDTIGIIYSLK